MQDEFLCKHSITARASRSRVRNVKEVLLLQKVTTPASCISVRMWDSGIPVFQTSPVFVQPQSIHLPPRKLDNEICLPFLWVVLLVPHFTVCWFVWVFFFLCFLLFLQHVSAALSQVLALSAWSILSPWKLQVTGESPRFAMCAKFQPLETISTREALAK